MYRRRRKCIHHNSYRPYLIATNQTKRDFSSLSCVFVSHTHTHWWTCPINFLITNKCSTLITCSRSSHRPVLAKPLHFSLLYNKFSVSAAIFKRINSTIGHGRRDAGSWGASHENTTTCSKFVLRNVVPITKTKRCSRRRTWSVKSHTSEN